MPNMDLVGNKLPEKRGKDFYLVGNSLLNKNKIFRILFVFVFLLTLFLSSNTSTAYASDRYWIGGTGNWSDTAHWSDSDGGSGGFSAPTSADNVFFSAGSFSTNGAVVTLDTTANTASLDFSGLDQTMTLTSSANVLNVYGSLMLSTNLTVTFTSTAYLYLKATAPQTITANGSTISWNIIYINGIGGTWTNTDDWNIGTGTLYHLDGTLNTNNKTISVGFYQMLTAGIKVLTLGSSIFNTSGFYLSGGANTTFNAGTSTINILGNLSGDNKSFYTVNLNATSSNQLVQGNNTFVNLSKANSKYTLTLSGNQIITETLTITGANSTNQRLLFTSSTVGTQRTITVDPVKVTASNVDFRDIKFQNEINLSAISGGSGDAGGNTGITFTPAQPLYFKKHASTANYGDTANWFIDEALTIPANRIPLLQDKDSKFLAGSFNQPTTLKLNVSRLPSLDMGEVINTVRIVNETSPYISYFDFYGSVNLNSFSTLAVPYITLLGVGSNTFGSNTNVETNYISFSRGNYSFNKNIISTTASLRIELIGNLDINGFNGSFTSYYQFTPNNVYLGEGVITLTGTNSNFYVWSGNLYPETATLIMNVSGTSNFNFHGANKNFNKVWFSGTHTGNFDISGSNTIAELIIDPGRKVRFTAGTTQQIGKLTASGTISNPITISSVTGATHTLNYTGATNAVGDYLNISYSNATPANKWYASNSTNSGNNSGWTFANSPDAPTGLTPTAGNTEVALSWTAPASDGGTAIVDYVVEYKLTTDSTWSIFADAISTLTTATIIGLTNGKSYDFRVSAVNNVGQGVASATTSATPFSPNDRYWVGGSGNWSDTAHWANVDDGAGGQSAPTSTNDVYFSAGSFSADGAIVTLDATANTASLDFTGIDQTVTLSSSVNSINIYGHLTLPPTNITWTFTGTAYTYLKATTSVNIIMGETTGRNFNQLFFDGIGGDFTQQDNWSIGSTDVFFRNGIFNTGNKNLTTTGYIYLGATGGNITMNWGSSIITCKYINYTSAGTKTFNEDTSTFIITGVSGTVSIGYPTTYYNVQLTGNGIRYVVGGCTFYNLTRVGDGSITDSIILQGDQTVTGTLTFTGNNNTNYRLLVTSNTIGIQRNITVDPAKVTASNVDFRDIRFQNAIDLSAISGGSGDAGGNTGITFTPAVPQYFKHTSGAVNWSDSTKWFSDASPRTTPGRVPLPQDDATFDADSFTGASTLTVNVPRIGRSLNMSGVNQTVTMTLANAIEVYGSYVLGNSITPTGSPITNLNGRGNFNLNTYNKTINRLHFYAPNGTYTNLSNLKVTSYLELYYGTLDLNDFNFSGQQFYIGSSGFTTYAGNGIIEVTNTTGTSIRIDGTFYSEGSTFKLNPASGSNNLTLILSGKAFNKIWFSGSHTGNFDFIGGTNNTIAELIIDPGRKVRFTAGTTQQIGTLTANGTVDNPITISSITGAAHTLNYTGATNVVGDYLNISYSTGTPANKWYASNSTDGGSNSGWIFADEPDAPTAVGASGGDSQVSLSWSPPAYDGGTAITDYAIEYKLTSEPTVWSTFADGVNTNTTGIVTGLTNGLSYDFRISVINLIGQGVPSSTITATPLTTPDAPRDVVATRLNASASVAFIAPISDGGSPITSYTVTSSPESHTEIGTTSPIIITGLTNGTAYTFTVTATNIAGTGPASTASNSVTPATVPDAPTAPSAIAGDAQVELSWIAPVWNGGETITDYVIEYKLSSEPTVWSTFSDGVTNNVTTTITGLTNAESYDFRIYAVNDVGQGSSSIETSATPITVPDAPTAVTGIAGNAEATISFTPPVFNGGSTINSYKVTSSPGNFTATGNASPLTVTGLTNGTAYTFTVTATNAVGEGSPSGASSPITPVTVPNAPTAVTAVEGNRQATVSFTAPLFNGGTPIINYTVTSSPGNFTATGNASPITVTGLTNGTTYTFTVKATNAVGSGGDSSPSNEVTLSTEPLSPINLASTVLGSSIGLSWSTPSSDGGSAIVDYVVEYQLSTGGEWAIFADGTNTNTTAIVNGLSNRTPYDFRVSALNIIGQSTPSSVVSATPGEPAQVLIQNFSNVNLPNISTSIRITNEGTLDYEYQYNWCITDSSTNLCGGGDDVFDSTAAKLINSGSNWDTDLVSTVLTPGDYYFHIKVLYGSESSNAYQSFTALATYPDTPTVGVATVGDRQATVSFTPSVFNGGSPITNYTATSTPGGLTGTGTTSPITVTGLTNGNSYTFNITATNAIGTSSASAFSNSVTPLSIPDAPTSLSAVAGDMKVDLSWIAPIYNGGSEVTDYIIEYKLITDSTWSVFSDGVSTNTTATITGLTNNLSYDFRVSATNIIGQSAVNTANITLPASVNRGSGSSGYYLPSIPSQVELPSESKTEAENITEQDTNKNITKKPTIKKEESKQTEQQNTNSGSEEISPTTQTDSKIEDINTNDNQIRVTPTEKSQPENNSGEDTKGTIRLIAIYGGGLVGGLVLLFIIFRIVKFIVLLRRP